MMPSEVQQSFIDESALEEVEAQEEDRHPEYDPDNDTDEEDDTNEVPTIMMEETVARMRRRQLLSQSRCLQQRNDEHKFWMITQQPL